MKLSEKIFYCRKKCGYSQEALAQLLGISRQAVSKWETGESEPEAGKLKLLADSFNITTDWLLSEEEPQEENENKQVESPKEDDFYQKLPKNIARLAKKYGWFLGLIISAQGCFVAILGLVARHIANSLFFPDDMFIDGMMPPHNPMLTMATFITTIGAVVAVAGLIFAIYLKRRFGDKKNLS